MRQVLIRFVFANGAFFQAALTEPAARDLIDRWKRGDAKGRWGDGSGWWAVDLDKLAAIHPVEAAPQPVLGQMPYGTKPGASGLN